MTTPDRPRRADPWMQMHSGKAWDILNPSRSVVDWWDIAHHLAGICRFNGACEPWYSVAEHCCHVHDILPPECRLAGLVHDAHEAITGDITAPMCAALHRLAALDAVEMIQAEQDKVIYAAAGLRYPLPPRVADAVKHADAVLLATERRDLMAEPPRPWVELPDPLPMQIRPWPRARAATEWMDRLRLWLPEWCWGPQQRPS